MHKDTKALILRKKKKDTTKILSTKKKKLALLGMECETELFSVSNWKRKTK